MTISLSGKPILITGASSGIGLATAMACAKAGMPVALAARRKDLLDDAVRSLTQSGHRAIAIQCDVKSKSDCASAVASTLSAFGSIYSVFANAGYGYESPVETMDETKLREIFETNFYGSLNIIWATMPHLRERKSGHILWCSSGMSKISLPNFAAYSATKAAQDHFGRAMRIELLGSGIHCSTVHPITTDTGFSKAVEAVSGKSRGTLRTPKAARQSAETVANAIVRCLQSPKGEVWTSLPIRSILALATFSPTFADWVLARRQRKLNAAMPH